MAARRRIRTRRPESVTINPTVEVPGDGLVQWGPRFGKVSDDTFVARTVARLASTKLTGSRTVSTVVRNPAVALTGTVVPSTVVDAQALALAGAADAAGAVAFAETALAGNTTATTTATLPAIALDGNAGAAAAIARDTVALAGATDAAAATTGTFLIVDLAPTDDTYLDRDNGTTANGSATTLDAQNNTAVVNNDENIYIAWDLTGFTGTATAITVRIFTETDQLVATTTDWEFYTHPSQPFDEVTATWDADEQPPGTQRQTGTYSAPVTPATVTITVDAADALNNAIGNWSYLRITGPSSGLDTTSIISVSSKESANTPEMDLTGSIT